MVNRQEQDSDRTPANQGVRDVTPEPNKINASTPYDFDGKNLTAYGGLLPVGTLLEKLGFRQLLEETLKGFIHAPNRSALHGVETYFSPRSLSGCILRVNSNENVTEG